MHAKEGVLILSLVAFVSLEAGYSQQCGTGAIFLPPEQYNALGSAPGIRPEIGMPGSIDLVTVRACF